MPTFIEEVRKEQIIETALSIIEERDDAAVSIGDIARKVGVSKGVITYYFKTKDVLIRHVIIRIIETAAAAILEEVEKKKTCRQKITAYVETLIKYWVKNRRDYQTILQLWSSITSPEERDKFNRNIVRATITYVSGLLREGNRAGEFHVTDIKETALAIQSSIDGVLVFWIFDDSVASIGKVTRKLLKNIDAMLGTE